MNFPKGFIVEYYMNKILRKMKPFICFALCIIICLTVWIISSVSGKSKALEEERFVLKIWQIDSFEGGKGSRADYLQKIGDEYSKESLNFVNVTSISADAARRNIESGTVPDIISYGAGFYGLENLISDYSCWCYGGYCILSLDKKSDFTDCTAQNTVINMGKDNRADIAAIFLGLEAAEFEKSTSAYVKLLNGDCKYLLGTQRDIFRLNTRGAQFSVKPVTEFNDLYQNISVISSGERGEEGKKFVSFLQSKSESIKSLGLFASGKRLYDNELKNLEGLGYKYKILSPISKSTKEKIDNSLKTKDINMLKNLMK